MKVVRCVFLLIFVCIQMIIGNANAQSMIGVTGQLNIPTAIMQKEGTFRGGVSYLPENVSPFDYPTGVYYVNFTIFSFFEVSFRETLLKCKNREGKYRYSQQDRSTSFKIRPIKESKYFPAVVLGTNDPYADQGRNYYASVYGVMTKTFSLDKENSSNIEVTAGYFKKRGDGNIYDGPFGGLKYNKKIGKFSYAVIGEYDSKGINAGVEMLVFKHLNVNVWSREMRKIAAGVSYIYTINWR